MIDAGFWHGGDWAEHRLVPDVMPAAVEGWHLTVRNPHSVRPWQHVVNRLSGCVCLAERLAGSGRALAEAWNLSLAVKEGRPVLWLVEGLRRRWPGELSVRVAPDSNDPHEAGLVKLDASKARKRLGWTRAGRLTGPSKRSSSGTTPTGTPGTYEP